jgi:hypothetical protein
MASPGFQAALIFVTMSLLASSEKEHSGEPFVLLLEFTWALLTGG